MADASGFFEVTFKPRGECQECDWGMINAGVADCRRRVKTTGHTVLRIRETVGKYYSRETTARDEDKP